MHITHAMLIVSADIAIVVRSNQGPCIFSRFMHARLRGAKIRKTQLVIHKPIGTVCVVFKMLFVLTLSTLLTAIPNMDMVIDVGTELKIPPMVGPIYATHSVMEKVNNIANTEDAITFQ